MFLSDRLLPNQPNYNPRAGRYTVGGKFVPDVEIDGLAQVERNILSAKLERLTQRLTNGTIDIPEWENEFADTLKKSHIRMTILASGGRQRTGLNSYAIAGRRLKEEYRFLDGFANALKDGELSEQQSIHRAKLYAQSTVQTYYEAFHFNKNREGFKKAWRTTDPAAKHCNSCPNHATLTWVDIDKVVPKGTKCECRGHCRCRIKYRRY